MPQTFELSSFAYEYYGGGTVDYITITDYFAHADASVVIPSKINGMSVRKIEPDAFVGCTSLKTVRLPDSVTSLEDCAFYYCTALTDIYLSDNINADGKATAKRDTADCVDGSGAI